MTWLSGTHVVRLLELVQDLIVVSLCIGLFCFMVMQLREMFLSLLPPLDFPRVTADMSSFSLVGIFPTFGDQPECIRGGEQRDFVLGQESDRPSAFAHAGAIAP